MVFTSRSEQETENLGRQLAKLARHANPFVLCLSGGLGAGKTVLVRGLAKALGYNGQVTSPTFSLVNEYGNPSEPPVLLHFDMYRLANSDELFDIGWYDYLDKHVVCAVEWAEKVADAMPENAIYAHLEGFGDGARIITLSNLSEAEAKMLSEGGGL